MDKRRQIKKGKLVLAEVNKNLIRTFGDNYVHVSEIDYFVETSVSRWYDAKRESCWKSD